MLYENNNEQINKHDIAYALDFYSSIQAMLVEQGSVCFENIIQN